MAATTGVVELLRTAAEFVLSMLFLGAAVVLALGLRRAWKQSRRTEVIIDTLGDGTGDATSGAAVVGLTYRLREEVVAALPELAKRAKKAVQRAESDPTSPISAFIREEDIDKRDALLDDITSSQKDLMQSMESIVPQGARGAYRVVASAVLRPKEVRVHGVLQRLNDHSGGIGLSFNVNHVGAEEGASRITLWEDADGTVDAKTVVERFHALVVPAARALACELLRQRLKVTMAERRRHRRGARGEKERHLDAGAVVELLVGDSYQSAAHLSAPATKSFYELAARALRKSSDRLDHYKLSYQLARAFAELARRQGGDRARAIELCSDSTKLFNRARNKLPAAHLDPSEQRAEELRIQTALAMNACLLAEFLPAEDEKAKSAASLVCALTAVEPAEYESDGVLYNVACALAVAARIEALARYGADRDLCLDRSKIWLLYAAGRNARWWTASNVDPDLSLLRDWIPDARRHLWEATTDSDQDGSLETARLKERIEKVVVALTPKFPPRPAGAPGNGPGSPPDPTRRTAPWRGEALEAVAAAVSEGTAAPRSEPRPGPG